MSQGEDTLAFQLRVAGLGTRFVTEHRFHPERKWRFDFAFPASLLAVEVEGGTWTNGRHSRGKGFETDCEKYAEAAARGWRVIRATTEQVKTGQCLGWIESALEWK